ncbi:GAF and ANTAR domain-containing protein [Cryptosporangium aurantiacum]|uniref:GAF domain-containing protein n=1 Tax=Cryptosporangium aurantiacum TaxID=134849 RepID=A0A1M7TZM8_9ACTN|nr:GAF and ANTAR domain-containing protein [Cryptosporangium aurantiacum]SHN76097.1 GAF domain-containing protein [Cryptosporangium aurantiacum]
MNTNAGGRSAVSADTALSLAELGRIALADTPLEQVLERVAVLARDTIPGADEVSVTLLVNERPRTAAFTGTLALELDERQYRNGFGPCMDAGRGGETLFIADMATETRWPDYTPGAAACGATSSLSVPLPVQEHIIGALNIYATTPDAFDERAGELGTLFAGYAGVAVANAHLYASTAELAEGMRAAMASRAVIEQAKGVLMAEHGCTAEQAFTQLTRMSQNANRKLREVAAAVVARTRRE